MRQHPIIAGNWKMNMTVGESITLVDALIANPNTQHATWIICPPYTHLAPIQDRIKHSVFSLGAQSISHHSNGAFTGDVSGSMLKSVGCRYVIIGHSERREYHNETPKILTQQLTQAFTHGLTPIFCVGETKKDRDNNLTTAVIEAQLIDSLVPVKPHLETLPFLIAYEPIWAIGTGVVASPEDAQQVHAYIRKKLNKLLPPEIANRTPILYGGSVSPENSRNLLDQQDIDGALVGGASLNADTFLAIGK